MPQETPTYDLMLLLSTAVDEDRRAKILKDVEGAITGGDGSIVHDSDWGTRPLAYRINHQADAEYHLLQFTGPPALLEAMGHNLGITDGVLRHRIIKVLPGTPPPPAPERVAVPAARPAAAPDPETAAASAPDASPDAAPDASPDAELDAEPEQDASAAATEPEAAAEPVSAPAADEAESGE